MRDDKFLLISGSRDWRDEEPIHRLIDRFDPGAVLIVHGKCRTGADDIADKYAKRRGYTVRSFPANWRPDGKTLDLTAGPRRNREMVTMGISLQRLGVEAHAGIFLLDGSSGTSGTLRLCQLAGFIIHLTER